MPNLDHDPQNPTDLLDRPIKEGDIVAWGTTFGQSAALAVCVIERIRYIRPNPTGDYRKPNEECERYQAEDYQLVLLPLKSTGNVTYPEDYVPDGFIDPTTGRTSYFRRTSSKPRTKTVKLVKNVVKLEAL